MSNLQRFDSDMDGYMEPNDDGRWVRFEAADSAVAVLVEALESLLAASQRNQEHYSEEAHDIAESRARSAIAKATGGTT